MLTNHRGKLVNAIPDLRRPVKDRPARFTHLAEVHFSVGVDSDLWRFCDGGMPIQEHVGDPFLARVGEVRAQSRDFPR